MKHVQLKEKFWKINELNYRKWSLTQVKRKQKYCFSSRSSLQWAAVSKLIRHCSSLTQRADICRVWFTETLFIEHVCGYLKDWLYSVTARHLCVSMRNTSRLQCTAYNEQNWRTQNMIKARTFFLLYFVMILTDKI